MSEKKTKIIQYTLILLSIVLILIGTLNGEAQIVFKKAIYICLECIGIG